MSQDTVATIFQQCLFTAVKSAIPMLLISLIIGLLISIFQTVTSIQEQTLTFVPKFLGIFLMLIFAGNWIMGNITALFTELCSNFSMYIQS